MAKKEATLILRIKEKGAKALKTTGDAFKAIGTKALVAVSGITAVVAATFKLAQNAERYNEVKRSFEALAESQGQNAEKMLQNLRELTKGTISDMDLMQKANQALLLGLPVDRFGDMAKIARAASKATGESMDFMLNSIVTGLGRGSKLILDNLGIVVNTEKAYEKYAATLGKTAAQLTDNEKKQAFINEAMRIGLANASKMGDAGLSLNDRWEQLKATLENFTIGMGQGFIPIFSIAIGAVNDLISGFKDFFSTLGTGAGFKFATQMIAKMISEFEKLGAVAKTVLGAVLSALSEAFSGNFKKAFSEVKKGAKEIPKVLAEQHLKAAERQAQIEEQFSEKRKKEQADRAARLKAALQKEREIQQADNDAKREMESANNLLKMEDEILFQEAMKEQRFAAQIEAINQEISNENNRVAQIQLAKKKQLLIEKGIDDQRKNNMTLMQQFEAFMNSERVKGLSQTLNHISGLQQSKNSEMVTIGKAAAIASITIATADSAMNAYKWGTVFGGPFLGATFAGLAIAAGAVQAANVAGVQLAEGGIVRATPGGIQATIGEGGQDEAVIPLDDPEAQERLGGGAGNTINFNGPILGDRAQAREFARMMDQELATLRRDGESISFDSDIR